MNWDHSQYPYLGSFVVEKQSLWEAQWVETSKLVLQVLCGAKPSQETFILKHESDDSIVLNGDGLTEALLETPPPPDNCQSNPSSNSLTSSPQCFYILKRNEELRV